ncbi:MAG TPA: Spy/CpxP family protein refolding chaperone [Planctomycetota bacterium]|nr:Spy/CpxP family protein refolding chaperone [Planctomycetota bacterium]
MKSRILFVICFLTAFGAGLLAGMLLKQPPAAQPQSDRFLGELNLTPEQREKMKAIWTEAMKNNSWQMQREAREAAQKERDEAMRALITDEQRPRFEAIQSAYQAKIEELSQKSRKARDEAAEKTKAILNKEQRVKYEEITKRRREGKHQSGTHDGKGPPPNPSGEFR